MPRTLVPLLLLATLAAPAARAAESYDNCTGFVDSLPAVIGTQGTWCLRQDLSTALAEGAAITIATNNVTLDCNHFKIGGLAAGPGTQTTGVLAVAKLNAAVRNCNVRGFFYGLAFSSGGGGHLVQDNRFEGNTFAGVRLEADQSTVRGNLVLDTGGSLVQPGTSYGMLVNGEGNHLLDNTVHGVVPGDASGNGIGIYFGTTGGGSLAHNRVGGLVSSATTTAIGIWAVGGQGMVHDNTVQGPALYEVENGILCSSQTVTAHQNRIAGFDLAIGNCQDAGNIVNSN